MADSSNKIKAEPIDANQAFNNQVEAMKIEAMQIEAMQIEVRPAGNGSNTPTNNQMTDDELDERYRATIDRFVDMANEFAEHDSIENVGMALLYAASRFNAYVVSQHADSKPAYQADRARAKVFFEKEYGEMLDENLQDYEAVYDKYHKYVKKQ